MDAPLPDLSRDELLSENAALRSQLAALGDYGLIFRRDPDHVIADARERFPLLVEHGDLRVGETQSRPHLLIEGDNYYALAALAYTHKNAIDLIYIDPPYNKEDSGFIYNDRRVTSKDRFKHSPWLSFMEPRLKQAWELLTDTGVLLISIDDNELASLMLLCEQIFGAGHLLGNISWIKRTQPVNSGAAKFQLQSNLEYVLAYSRCPKSSFPGFELAESGKKAYPHTGHHGACRFEGILTAATGRYDRETMKFPILGMSPPEGQRWKIGVKRAAELVAADKIQIIDGQPKRAVYADDEPGAVTLKPFWSHLDKDITGTAQAGKAELKARMGPHDFDTVKPLGLMRELLRRFPTDITVLDFFAGSGTTGEAVLQMNSDDGGSRQAILCTNDEGNICRDITHRRIEKAILGWQDATDPTKVGAATEGLGGELRFFTIGIGEGDEIVERSDVRDDMKLAFRNRCHDLLRVREGCYSEVDCRARDYSIYTDGARTLAILWRPTKADALAGAIEKHCPDQPVALYIFSLGSGEAEAAAAITTRSKHVELQAIPEELLRTYERLMQRRMPTRSVK